MNSRYLSKVTVLLEFAIALTMSVHAPLAASQGLSFAPAVTYFTGEPQSVVLADVNGDGKPDLIVANGCLNGLCYALIDSPGTVVVFLGNGDGTFKTGVAYDSGGWGPVSVAVADVNGDGKPDLIVANECKGLFCGPGEGGAVGVLLGNGDGTFQTVVTYGPNDTVAVAVADVNEDGKPDIIVANDDGVGVLLGNGDGTFQKAVTYSTGGYDSFSLAVADVNGDGKPDLIVVNRCSDQNCDAASVGVLLGNSDGTFQPAVTYPTGGSAPFFSLVGGSEFFSLAVADVNGDGKPDLIVVNWCSVGTCPGPGSVGVLLGNGNGTFQKAVTYNTGGYYPSAMAVADVDADGKPDLVVANWCNKENCSYLETPGSVGVLLGNGDGTFKTAVTYDSGGRGAESVALADVSGDGKPDLIVGNTCNNDPNCNMLGPNGFLMQGNGLVGVLLGNGDGTFQTAATYSSGGVPAVWLAVGDLNGDGKPDFAVANVCPDWKCDDGTVGVLINTTPWPPAVTVSANPKSLWPPNGKLVPVTVSGVITDRGGGINASTVMYAVVDEYGQVQPSGPIILGPGGKFSTIVWLQASRNGSDKDGRKYTITVGARNNAGEQGSASTVVTIAHDNGH